METEEVLRLRLNHETSQITWTCLERFFAQGRTRLVDPKLDLVEVGVQIIRDNNKLIEQWVKSGALRTISNHTAKQWINENILVWSVVVRPWVLVQPVNTK